MAQSALDLILRTKKSGGNEVKEVSQDLKGLKGAGEQASQGAQKATGGLGALGTVIKGIVATGILMKAGTMLLDFGRNSITAASDVEEMTSKFGTVFTETGGQVEQALGEFADAAQRSKFALMGYAAELGDTLKPMGFTEQAAADLATQMVELATDLSSFNNIPMDDALRRLQGTLIGSHENALKFGVVINENTLKAELSARGWDRLTGAQLEQAKVQARINLLMQGTVDAQGDAIRTAEGYANTSRGLDEALYDLQVVIGNSLLPTMTEAKREATEWVRSLTELLSTSQRLEAQWKVEESEIRNLSGSYEEYAEGMIRLLEEQGYFVKQTEEGIKVFKREGLATREVTEEMNLLTKAQHELALRGAYLTASYDANRQAAQGLTAATGDLQEATDLYKTAADNLSLTMTNLGENDLARAATAELQRAFEAGLITAHEYETMMLEIGTSYGGLSEKEAKANAALYNLQQRFYEGEITLKQYLNGLKSIHSLLFSLPEKVEVDVLIKVKEERTELLQGIKSGGIYNPYGGGKPNAMGGPVGAGEPVVWNEPGNKGEIFVPAGSGYILNQRQAERALTDALAGQQTVNHYWIMNNNMAGGVVNPAESFGIMKALAGVS